MSIKFMSKAWEQKITPTQKLVFLSLCDNSNDEGLCYPSITNIMLKTGFSNKTIIKTLSELIDLKFIIKHQRAKKDGGRYSTLYLVFPLENYENLDKEYKLKFIQSEEVTLYSQSEEVTPKNGIQSEEATHKPSLYNHHLYILLNSEEKNLYNEYIKLRTTIKLKTTLQIHDRLLTKYFEFGRNTEVIEKAINGNWRDFYSIQFPSPKQQYKRFEDMTLEEKMEYNEAEKQRKIEENYGR